MIIRLCGIVSVASYKHFFIFDYSDKSSIIEIEKYKHLMFFILAAVTFLYLLKDLVLWNQRKPSCSS